MTDFHLNQKLDLTSGLRGTANDFMALRKKSKYMSQRWFDGYFQDTAPYDFTAADLVGTQFEGLTEDEVENIIGSLDAFETFMETHAVNFAKIAGV